MPLTVFCKFKRGKGARNGVRARVTALHCPHVACLRIDRGEIASDAIGINESHRDRVASEMVYVEGVQLLYVAIECEVRAIRVIGDQSTVVVSGQVLVSSKLARNRLSDEDSVY
jgi:hypothetical protein